jgi:hypothetical protein
MQLRAFSLRRHTEREGVVSNLSSIHFRRLLVAAWQLAAACLSLLVCTWQQLSAILGCVANRRLQRECRTAVHAGSNLSFQKGAERPCHSCHSHNLCNPQRLGCPLRPPHPHNPQHPRRRPLHPPHPHSPHNSHHPRHPQKAWESTWPSPSQPPGSCRARQ